MPTLAELQINVDSTDTIKGKNALLDLADASSKVTKALKDQKAAQESLKNSTPTGGSSSSSPSGGGSGAATKTTNDLSSAIDNQTKKLKALEEQRKRLNASELKTTNPAEYTRLNQLLDSNITLTIRQGNAMDRLAAQANKEALAKEKLATADKARIDAQAAAVASSEALAAKAVQSAQRELDATINSLSGQIKAQQEYNRTLEQLNKARAVSGMNGGAGALSAGEYDSYVKLAAAKRDSALATAAEGAEAERVKTKIDSVTATLGKAERAEIQFARAVTVLNDGLKLGVITQDQYDTKIQQVTTKRDAAITAANSNTAAEQRYVRELQNVMSAYDPVLRAQTTYNESIKTLATGLQSGKLSIEQFNKALGDQRTALDNLKAAQPGSDQSQSNRYQSALDRLLPYNAQLRSLAEAEKALQTQQQSGKLVTQEQIRNHQQATQAIAAERKEIERRTTAGNAAGVSAKQNAAALRGLPAQFSDIVVSLQGGQAPLTVFLQQGAQIKDMFGGVVPALKAFGGALVNLVNPATIAGASIAALAVAAFAGRGEMIAFNKAIISSGNASGVSGSQFSILRDRLDETVTTAGAAAEALTLIAASGKIAGSQFEAVAETALLMERATGQAISKTVEDFASLGKDPVEAAVRLDEKYRFLTTSILAQADALVKQGKEVEATTLLQSALSDQASITANEMIENAGYIEHAWFSVKQVVSETWDALKGIGRTTTAADEMRELLRQRKEISDQVSLNDKLLGGFGNSGNKDKLKDIDGQITQIKQRIQYEQLGADNAAATEKARRESVSAESSALKRYENSLKGVEKAENDLKKVKLENSKIVAGGDVSADVATTMKANLDAAEKALKDAKAKRDKPKPPGALDTTDIQEVKSNLALITAEYDGYYKKVTALGEANIVSAQATYYSQKAILEAESKAVSGSYDEQIDAIKKLQAQKGNSRTQTISLNNQLTKAESQRAVEMEKISTKMETLQTAENGRIQERTRNIAAYKAALDAQLEASVDEGARNADGVGRGSRQAELAKKLAENDRSFAKQQAQLSKSLGEGMDPTEYAKKLDDLRDTHTKMTDQIVSNDKQIQAANADWTNGFTAAVENAQDAGMNFAGTVESALTGAFDKAGDALATFVTTGKLNFRDFTVSVLSDMAKLASQQAASSTLGAIFSIVGNAFAGGVSGGTTPTTTSVGTNSYTFNPQLNTSGAVYGQAKGGAWSGGTQMFAQGGAFTNSIVSQPTAFGMSNGAKGIMGEAGDEAIVPLARTRNGDLGIRAMGGGGSSGGTVINVNVQVADSGTSSSSDGGSAWDNFGTQLGGYVRKEVYTILNTETRPGGTIQAQK